MLDLHNLLADTMRLETFLYVSNKEETLGVFSEIRAMLILPLNNIQKWMSNL